jgi:uncharacterized protein YerC
MSVSEVNSSSWHFEWFSKEDPLEAKKKELLQKLKDSSVSLKQLQEELQFVKDLTEILQLPALFSNSDEKHRLVAKRAYLDMVDVLKSASGAQTVIARNEHNIRQTSDWEMVKKVSKWVEKFMHFERKTDKYLNALCASGFTHWTAADWEKISEIFAEQNKHFADIFLLRHMVAVEEALPDNLYFPTRQLPKLQKPTNPLATHSIYANLAVNNLFLNQL